MALALGTRIGVFEVTGSLGAGGMGEVYRAKDTKLGRDVALKILSEQFAADPDRLARFKREAQVLASLNHPHIGSIHGLEESDGMRALVLELVEGETLADRLGLGPISLNEALPIARQIAEALEAAHEKGIIHRDLKPSNIKLRSDGTVKVLDFGLAKALDAPDGSGPTLLVVTDTEIGTILGTTAYMSPEQSGGQKVDKRTDIWAFGCVLYELLTGRMAFSGVTRSDVIAAIMEREPDWMALPAATPPSIRRLLERCLTKDPKRRLRDIGDARIELENPLSPDLVGARAIAPTTRAYNVPRWEVWLGAFAIVGLATAVIAGWRRGPTVPQLPISKFSLPMPSGFEMASGQIPNLAVSPDGSKVVFATSGRLYLRAADRFDAELIPGTDDAVMPFFSPDGAWIGFSRRNALMKVPVAGGPPVRITDAAAGNSGGTWGHDGRIVFAGGVGNGGLWSVSADGGTPEQITVVSGSAGETNHMWPDFLPDGTVLYTVLGPSGHAQDARLVVEDPAGRRRVVVAQGVTYGRYVATGHLLYADENGTLLLQPFDLRGRRTTGPARAVLAGVRVAVWGGAVSYAVSSTGTLAYVTGTELQRSVLAEVDLAGRERRRFGTPRFFNYLVLSPDGRTLAMRVNSTNNDDIYLMDLESQRFDRFSFDVAEDESPVWSPDGRRIAYSSAATGDQRHIVIKTVASVEREQRVYTGKYHLHLTSWSPDGRWLAFYDYQPRSIDLWLLDLNDASKLVPVANTPAAEANAVFSPDGRWLAYNSDETGRLEVYVVSFPGLGGKQQVSREGGVLPRWSVTGQELFFRAPGRMMMARRAVGSEATPWQTPTLLFDVPAGFNFVPTLDGRSFYVIVPNPDAPAREIRVIQNWFEELKRLVPTN